MLKNRLQQAKWHLANKVFCGTERVAQLKTACNVSLKNPIQTLPSKEAMIVGALEYATSALPELPVEKSISEAGLEAVVHIFVKLQQWLESMPHGCMSMNAIAAFPDNELINQKPLHNTKNGFE